MTPFQIDSIPTPENWKDIPFHPLAELVDFGAGIDLPAVVLSMQMNGYDRKEEIIIVWVEERKRDEIIDGRHRRHCAIAAEVEPSFGRFAGGDVLAFVGKKAFRQHLDVSQRARLAAKLIQMKSQMPINIQPRATGQTEAARALNVSRQSVANATKVLEHGTAALNKAVDQGTISVTDAVKIANEPAKVQNDAVKKVESGKSKTASAAVNPPSDRFICDRCKRQGYTFPRMACQSCKDGPGDAAVKPEPAKVVTKPAPATTPAPSVPTPGTPAGSMIVPPEPKTVKVAKPGPGERCPTCGCKVPDAIELPFASDQFKAAWDDWAQARKENGKALKPTTIKAQHKKLLEMGEERAIAALIHSTAAGYQGIFEPTANGKPHTNGKPQSVDGNLDHLKDFINRG